MTHCGGPSLAYRPRESTVRAYAARGQMPAPDGRLGRTPWWRPSTIEQWRKERSRG